LNKPDQKDLSSSNGHKRGSAVVDSNAGRLPILPLTRASEWWEFKLVLAVLTGYLTALHLGISIWDALPQLGLLLASLLPGAIFVSVLNDWTDKADDAAAGKENRQLHQRRIVPAILLFLSLLGGGLFAWIWRDNVPLLVTYGMGWAAYALYSIPPIRLKKRGFPGLISDAVGANVVPAVLSVLLVGKVGSGSVNVGWLAAVFCWSLCFGLRGILWHQIGDLESDQRSGTQTFVMRVGVATSMKWARWFIFPLEVFGLVVLIVLSGWVAAVLAAISFAVYVKFVLARIDRFEMQMGLVKPRPRGIMVLQEYYDVFLPFALLLASAFYELGSLIVLVLHAALFPIRWRQMLVDAWKLRDPQYQSRSVNKS
jgi:4-hydroxybenzoate polyprenyltransferase